MKELSKIVLGTVQMGLNYGINNLSGKIGINDSKHILEFAHDSGIRFLDTAEGYGESHKIIGQYHKEYPTKIFSVITKIPHTVTNAIIAINIESYLDEMNINKIDTLLFHSFKHYKENKLIVRRLKSIQKNGLVDKIGVSVYSNDEFEEVINDNLINVIQFPFNVFDNLSIKGFLINRAKEKNIELHSRSVFLQGLFFKKEFDQNNVLKYLKNELLYIKELSFHYKVPLETLLLNFCIMTDEIDKILIGVDNINHLKSNIDSCKIILFKEIYDEINSIKIKNLNYINPSLWEKLF